MPGKKYRGCSRCDPIERAAVYELLCIAALLRRVSFGVLRYMLQRVNDPVKKERRLQVI